MGLLAGLGLVLLPLELPPVTPILIGLVVGLPTDMLSLWPPDDKSGGFSTVILNEALRLCSYESQCVYDTYLVLEKV